MQKFTYTALDAEGRPIANANVSVFQGGTNTLAALYEDNESTGKANPLTSNINGFVEAKIPAGTYDIQTAARGVTVRVNGFEVYNASFVSVPTGAVLDFGGIAAPTGFLLCAGQAVSRVDFSALFAVIGTAFGAGDGTTTFNLPDYRSRTGFGKDDMGGTAANRITSAVSGINGATLGASGGSQAMQQHTHAVSPNPHSHTVPAQSGVNLSGGANTVASTQAPNTTIATSTASITLADAGTGNSQNMPPAIIVNKIIKT